MSFPPLAVHLLLTLWTQSSGVDICHSMASNSYAYIGDDNDQYVMHLSQRIPFADKVEHEAVHASIAFITLIAPAATEATEANKAAAEAAAVQLDAQHGEDEEEEGVDEHDLAHARQHDQQQVDDAAQPREAREQPERPRCGSRAQARRRRR